MVDVLRTNACYQVLSRIDWQRSVCRWSPPSPIRSSRTRPNWSAPSTCRSRCRRSCGRRSTGGGQRCARRDVGQPSRIGPHHLAVHGGGRRAPRPVGRHRGQHGVAARSTVVERPGRDHPPRTTTSRTPGPRRRCSLHRRPPPPPEPTVVCSCGEAGAPVGAPPAKRDHRSIPHNLSLSALVQNISLEVAAAVDGSSDLVRPSATRLRLAKTRQRADNPWSRPLRWIKQRRSTTPPFPR